MVISKNALASFFKYNVVALIATSVDFLVLISLTELAGFWYLISAFLGAVAGGFVGFVLERNWTFMSTSGSISKQAAKYILVSIGSILLNTLGLYLIVELSALPYIYAKVIVATLVGVGFNFFMHKYYIFK